MSICCLRCRRRRPPPTSRERRNVKRKTSQLKRRSVAVKTSQAENRTVAIKTSQTKTRSVSVKTSQNKRRSVTGKMGQKHSVTSFANKDIILSKAFLPSKELSIHQWKDQHGDPDLVLIVGKTKFPVHKRILIDHSAYFRFDFFPPVCHS